VEIDSDDELFPKPKKSTTKSKPTISKKKEDVDMKDVGNDNTFVAADVSRFGIR
jgi:replication factor C subunit 1